MPDDSAADDALDQLHELMHHYRSQMQGLARDDADGLGPMEARALGYFARHPDATASDLVQHARRDKAQVTRLVQLLVERGLLVALADPADRRSRRLRLTDAGLAMQARMLAHRQRLARQLVTGFTSTELGSLLSMMTRLRHNFAPAPSPAEASGQGDADSVPGP